MTEIVIFDVDGTLVDGRVWRGILEYSAVSKWNVRWLYAATLPLLLLMRLRLISEPMFRDRWVRGLARLLKGWSVADLEKLGTWISTQFLTEMYRKDVVRCLHSHRAKGHTVMLVSTMLDVVLESIARHLGVDGWAGTILEIRAGKATGRIVGASCVGQRKVEFARASVERSSPGAGFRSATAYADSWSDLPLLEAVSKAVVVYPDERLRAVAGERGWQVLDGTEDQTC